MLDVSYSRAPNALLVMSLHDYNQVAWTDDEYVVTC
jgi:hypothetical protein